MLAWAIITGSLDHVLRPILIKRGADLPLLLIFAGVIGGLLAFGLIGLFVGPVVLAVTYTLLEEWVAPGPRRSAGSASTAGKSGSSRSRHRVLLTASMSWPSNAHCPGPCTTRWIRRRDGTQDLLTGSPC